MKYIILCSLFFITALTGQAPLDFPAAPNIPAEFQMNEDELKEMVNFLDGLSDKELQELEELGKKVLTDMGYNPETLEPLNPETPSLKDLYAQQQKAPETEQPVVIPQPITPEKPSNTDELARYLDKILKSIHSLQNKSVSIHIPDRRITRWIPELRDLNFYITTIRHSAHLDQLQSDEYKELLRHIQELGSLLIQNEPLFVITEPVYDAADDSYEILGITPHATTEEIEEAYLKIKNKKSPDSIKATLSESHASEKEIERAIKEARLSMSLVTDAYEKLHDPKTREQIDRERHAHSITTGTIAKGSQKSLDMLAQGLTTAIYTHQIFNEFEQFFKKYEPIKLEQKKALEKAEADRKKEQEAANKIIPRKTPLGQVEPGARVAQEATRPQNYDRYAYDYPPYYPEMPEYRGPNVLPEAQQKSEDKKGGSEEKSKPTERKEKDKDSDKKDKKEEKETKKESKKEGKDDSEKKPKDVVAELFKEITKPFDAVHELILANRTETEVNAAIQKIHEKAGDIAASFKKFVKHLKEKDVKKKYEKQVNEFLARHEKYNDRYQKKIDEALKENEGKIAKLRKKAAELGKTTPSDTEELEDQIKEIENKKGFHHIMEQYNKLKELVQKKPKKPAEKTTP